MNDWGHGVSESLVERGVVPAGIVGAIGGAIGGAALAAGLGVAYPAVCGMAGVMAGSTVSALVWSAAARFAVTVSGTFSSRAKSHAI